MIRKVVIKLAFVHVGDIFLWKSLIPFIDHHLTAHPQSWSSHRDL